MALEKGTQVEIVSEGSFYQGFPIGLVVEATGYAHFGSEEYEDFSGTIDGETIIQTLEPAHYKIVNVQKVVDSELPRKVVYAVHDADDEVVVTTDSRDHARRVKALWGGKRRGIRIFQYVASKEIR